MATSYGFCIMPHQLCISTQKLARSASSSSSHSRGIGDRACSSVAIANSAKFISGIWHNRVICVADSSQKITQITAENRRRSANYQPSIWTYENLQSLESHHADETSSVKERATKLEEKVRCMISRTEIEPAGLVELIDDVQRLGLSCNFEDDINRALLHLLGSSSIHKNILTSLHATAIFFRILRQYGFDVPQDVFENFKDEEGNFKREISDDVQGMISLYEASHLTFEGEDLWKAKEFSANLMNIMIRSEGTETKVAENIRLVLEGLPYHHTPYRLEARRNIDRYQKNEPLNVLLLELAKLDFNMVQSLHQQELQEMSRWWRDIGLTSRLRFARDRLTESFFWSVGIVPEPKFSYCRKQLTKVAALITVLDDVYDVYGTLDELELFTLAVHRWDVVNAINTLPDYMILCFLTLYNTVNEMAFDIFREKGVKCLPYLTKSWSDLCKSFLQEAKWCNYKVTPTFSEYLQNALVSSSGEVLLIHSYFSLSQQADFTVTEQALNSLTNHHHLLQNSSTVFRISNDLATTADEMERGESTNSITCYMQETGVSEEHAREYLRTLIEKAWQKMNKCLVTDSTFPKAFIRVAMNLARIAQCTYQYGDGHGRPDNISNTRIKSLLVDPIPLN